MLTPIEPRDPRLRAALAAEGLPTADLDGASRAFFAWTEGAEVHGFGGLELYGPEALLRSVVILPAFRGRARGAALIGHLARAARERGAMRLWLLTLTAADFFARAGFERCARGGVPAAIAATTEFRELCPASAVCMRRDL